jgi:hypothetical protein
MNTSQSIEALQRTNPRGKEGFAESVEQLPTQSAHGSRPQPLCRSEGLRFHDGGSWASSARLWCWLRLPSPHSGRSGRPVPRTQLRR